MASVAARADGGFSAQAKLMGIPIDMHFWLCDEVLSGELHGSDTLALAEFRCGEVRQAVEHARQALRFVGDKPQRAELENTLREYEAALQK